MELPISECGGKTNLLRKSIAQLNAKHVRSILDSLGPTDVRRKVLKVSYLANLITGVLLI